MNNCKCGSKDIIIIKRNLPEIGEFVFYRCNNCAQASPVNRLEFIDEWWNKNNLKDTDIRYYYKLNIYREVEQHTDIYIESKEPLDFTTVKKGLDKLDLCDDDFYTEDDNGLELDSIEQCKEYEIKDKEIILWEEE